MITAVYMSANVSAAGEQVYELAMYLDLFSRTCFPSWSQIFVIAERVMLRLAELDPELHLHLTHIAQIDALVDSNVSALFSASYCR